MRFVAASAIWTGLPLTPKRCRLLEHEEVTKVKNINTLELGRHCMDTWYFSPFPREIFPDGAIDRL